MLPLWLSRKHDHATASGHLKEITCPILTYQTRVYDSFFTELLPSRFGPELKTYFDRVAFINGLSKRYSSGLPSGAFSSYVEALALAVEVADELAKEIHRYCSAELLANWSKENDYNGLVKGSEESLYRAALYRTKLQDLEQYLSRSVPIPSLPRRITEKEMKMLAWVTPARTF